MFLKGTLCVCSVGAHYYVMPAGTRVFPNTLQLLSRDQTLMSTTAILLKSTEDIAVRLSVPIGFELQASPIETN